MKTDKAASVKTDAVTSSKLTWEKMKLAYLGKVSELVKGGGGKSQNAADSGDVLKPKGQG